MIRNIIFDIGNVLVAFQWKKYYKSFGYTEEIQERLAKATVLSEMWNEYDKGALTEQQLLDAFVRNDPQLEPVIRECLSCIDGMLHMYDYTIPWIKQLKQNGYSVYYLSNMSAAATRDCAKDLAFVNETDGGILSFRERMIKPDPAIYQLLMERYSLKPEECLFVDDTEKNIFGARNVGMQGVLFRNKEQACEEMRNFGVNI